MPFGLGTGFGIGVELPLSELELNCKNGIDPSSGNRQYVKDCMHIMFKCNFSNLVVFLFITEPHVNINCKHTYVRQKKYMTFCHIMLIQFWVKLHGTFKSNGLYDYY